MRASGYTGPSPDNLNPYASSAAIAAPFVGGAVMGGNAALAPLAAKFPRLVPFLKAMAQSSAIGYAREKIPVVGKYIPQAAEMAPYFFGGEAKGKTSAPVERDATKLNVPYAGEEAPQESILSKTNPPLVKPTSRQAVSDAVDNALDVQPLKPGVPMRQQMAPAAQPLSHTKVESSAITSHAYDAEANEMHVVSKGGQHYVYGDVSPEQADAFANTSSKGKAWAQFKQGSSPLVAKIINGKRVPVRPVGGDYHAGPGWFAEQCS